ncbi:hypothetical protein F4808DRAFT_459602 [Astrocystis sublimbata]|nr:hypothetical protein F4808DRAFT_459602 [Astrocystis sublimbata]
MSNSSDASPLCSPEMRTEDIVFSSRPSPGNPFDNPQVPRSPQRYLRSSSTCSSPRSSHATNPTNTNTTNTDESPVLGSAKSIPIRSKPIAIELPVPKKKTNSAPVYTPPAPLTARGDLPGGYFPLHEEQNRLYRPHPFHLDASKARLKSIQRASNESSPEILSSSHAAAKGDVVAAAAPKPPSFQPNCTLDMPNSFLGKPRRADPAATTPVASYLPLGDRSSMPMGKYYPSNYERRKDEKKSRQHRTTTSAPAMSSSSKSDSQVPTVNQTPSMGHGRTEPTAKARLQQYQRDMIAQASIALGRGNPNDAALTTIRPYGFSHMIKPNKPRLAPLGSPGPVTPMELEGSDVGYLGVHGGIGNHAELSLENFEDSLGQEGSNSPTPEAVRTTTL